MKKFFTLLMFAPILMLQAQVMDISVTDCNNNSTSIHGVLATGKVLVVASDGLDCSVCKGKAPGLQSWAAQNKTKVQVWGAMTYTYSNSAPSCVDVTTWVNNYSWNDIYTFVDANRHWFQSGTPRYTVYSPLDSTLAYQGFSESDAFAKALELASQTSVSIKETAVSNEFYMSQSTGSIGLHYLPKSVVDIQVTSLVGKVVKKVKMNVETDKVALSTTDLGSGIYLVSVQNNQGFRAVRKIYVR